MQKYSASLWLYRSGTKDHPQRQYPQCSPPTPAQLCLLLLRFWLTSEDSKGRSRLENHCMMHPMCNICCIEALIIFFLQAVCTITGGVRQEQCSPCINWSDTRQGTFCHTAYLPPNGIYNKDIFTIFYLNHVNTWDQHEIAPFSIIRSIKYEKIINKTWNTKNAHIFFSPWGYISHTTFSLSFNRKLCWCSLCWFIRDVCTWGQQVMCHFLYHTRLSMIIFKQIWKIPIIFTIRDPFFGSTKILFLQNHFIVNLRYFLCISVA